MRPGGPLSLARIRPPSGLASAPRTMSVSIQLKYATPTSTPSGRTSIRSTFANASTPDFDAAYADIPGLCATAASDATTST